VAALVLALGGALGATSTALEPATATAATPVAHPTPVPTPTRAAPRSPAVVSPQPGAVKPIATATPVPTPTAVPTPLGDAAAAGRRRLRSVNSTDEGFLLGLPDSAGPGAVAYVPPQPGGKGGDGGPLILAALAGLLAALGGGAVVLALLLRPRAVPATAGAHVSVPLAPHQAGRWPLRLRRRPARLSRETFDRLPPLVQLALLDHSRSPGEADEPGDAPPARPPG
jgi:hypothetical protein